jgi:hypothetical protein
MTQTGILKNSEMVMTQIISKSNNKIIIGKKKKNWALKTSWKFFSQELWQ